MNYSAVANQLTSRITRTRSSLILVLRLTLLYSSHSSVLFRTHSQSHIATDGQSVSKSWCPAPSGAHDQIFITVWQLRSRFFFFFFVGRPLWREDGSFFCLCCWRLPAQCFSGPSPLVLTTVFYCLRFETSLSVASYDSQGHGGGIRPRLHTGKPLLYFIVSSYNSSKRTPRKTRVTCYQACAFIGSLPSNEL
jgi:hypothetical protein